MRRKVVKVGGLRLSPNEEAQLLKEEHERRRKLRLQQVREQERNIALQIRQDVKQRRDEHLNQLAEVLEMEWQKTQDEKIKALEKLYLSSLQAMGEGHREAEENKPDLETLAKQAEERKQIANMRFKEALKEQKNQKEKLLREQARRANARRHAVEVEKERAARVASLPPPPPHPFENVELKRIPSVKVSDVDHFVISRHHLFDPHVDREMDAEQPDARLLAKEEAKQKEELQNEKERERREQLEKAYLRGKHAMKMVRLARDKEKLMKELEQLQNMDLARRRRIVAQMPPQLFEPAYRRMEINEEWQTELEYAFEDMYTGNMKMRGDLILHLDPQPLPAFSDRSQDDELEFSQEREPLSQDPPRLADEPEESEPSGSELEKTSQPQAKLALKKLLNKIRSQKDAWSSRCESEMQSDMGTIESGTISNGRKKLDEVESVSEPEPKSDPVAEHSEEILDQIVVAGNVLTKHPQEQAAKIRMESGRSTQTREQQPQQQPVQSKEQKLQLETDFQMAEAKHQEQEAETEKAKRDQECQTVDVCVLDPLLQQQQEAEFKTETSMEPWESSRSKEDGHLKRIHDCQQRLLMQNRMHQDSIDEARRRLEEYHHKLKRRYQSVSLAFLGPTDRLAHLNSILEPSSRAQGVDVTPKITLLAYEPSKNDLVQELVPSEQKNQEQRLEDQVQSWVANESQIQVNQKGFQSTQTSCSLQEKENVDPVGTSVTEALEFQRIRGSSLIRSEDTSVITQPVAHIQNIRFAVPGSDSSGCSEALLSDKLIPPKPPVEKSLLPTFLKHQDIRKENRLNTAPSQANLPFRSVSSLLSTSVGEAESIPEPSILKNDSRSESSCSDIVELRDRLLASSESIEVQQEHLKELQKQLDEQREILLSRQKAQEGLLLQKHALLKQQMEHQQETLKGIIKRAELSRLHRGVMEAEANDFSLLTSLVKKAKDDNLKQVYFGDMDNSSDSTEPSESFQSMSAREQKQRFSKPPLTKVKPGLNLEQHELSVITELDTPRSGRLSGTGFKEWLTPNIDKLHSSKSPAESFQEEPDLLRISIDSEELNCRGSVERESGSLYEEPLGKAGGLYNSVCSRTLPGMKEVLSNFSADARSVVTFSDPSLRPNSQVTLSTAWSPGLLSAKTSTQQVACDFFSSSALSTAGFTSNYNPDRSLASTEGCSAKERTRYFSSPANLGSTDVWEASDSLLHKHNDHPDAPSSRLTFKETDLDESKIQQIIHKYRKGFTQSPLGSLSSSCDLAVGLDATDIEKHFPNFHRELFQPLEASFNFDRFSTISQHRASNNSKELSKISDLSKSQELTASILEERSNGASLLIRGNLPSVQLKEQTAAELFEHLPLENTLHKFRESFGKSGPLNIKSKQILEISKSPEDSGLLSPENIQCKELEDEGESVCLHSSTENFHSLSPMEDWISVHQTTQDDGPRKDSLGRTDLEQEDVGSNEERPRFVELPTLSFKISEMVTGNGLRNEDVEIDLPQGSSDFAQEQSFLRLKEMLSFPPGTNGSIPACSEKKSEQEGVGELDRFQQPNVTVTQADISDSCLSQHPLPVWETLTGRGILEEPELTLSSNDISTAESELLHSDLSEVKSFPKSKEFLSLNPVDEFLTPLDCPPGSPQEELDPQKTKPDESAPAHGSLQESFLQLKKDFIERSSKRVEKLKNRKQSSEKPQLKESQLTKTQLHKQRENLTSGAAVHPLKKVEVRVCSAADRKAAEVQMHQRTSRLYNNLAEVKNKKEEKDRRENYARNRERAKEFQKKTLERLRARKAHGKI